MTAHHRSNDHIEEIEQFYIPGHKYIFFSAKLAKELKSVELSILCKFISEKISQIKKTEGNNKTDRTWLTITSSQITSELPFFSEKQITKWISVLIKKNILLCNSTTCNFINSYSCAFKDEKRFVKAVE
jgi:hypothetical protein